MTLEQAIALGFDESIELAAAGADRSSERNLEKYAVQAPSPRSSESIRLTTRELAVLALIAAGKSNRVIAAALYMSLRSVEHHITSIYGKLGVHSKAGATAYAIEHNIPKG